MLEGLKFEPIYSSNIHPLQHFTILARALLIHTAKAGLNPAVDNKKKGKKKKMRKYLATFLVMAMMAIMLPLAATTAEAQTYYPRQERSVYDKHRNIINIGIGAGAGALIGAIAGFYGGLVDKFLSGYVFNVFLAFPGLLLAIALVAFLGAGQGKLIAALCVIGWVGYARVMRGQVLKVREYDYVLAARALGASNFRILFTHILPNAIQPLIVQASLGMAGAVLSEATLSFLGLGIPPPAPSWGTMIEEARQFFSNSPHVLFFPGAAIALTVLAFNFIGDGLREYLDPKQRAR